MKQGDASTQNAEPSPTPAYPPRVPKKLVSLRIDEDILAYFRAGGRGYQTRMNAALRAAMKAATES